MSEEEQMIAIKLTPIREIWHNDQSYRIYAADTEEKEKIKLNKFNNITIKGYCEPLHIDREYSAKLVPTNTKYGIGYEIVNIYEDITSTNGQRAFLESILTATQAKNLFDAYPNENIVDLIKNDEINLKQVKGIGDSTLEKIKNNINENLQYQIAFEKLKPYGFTNNLIMKMVKYFKSPVMLVQELKKNPYCITAIPNIGFLKADEVAIAMGIKKENPFRIQYAIRYTLKQESMNGHTYMTIDNLLNQVYEFIHIDYRTISEQLLNTPEIIIKDDRVSLKQLYDHEEHLAQLLLDRIKYSTPLNIDIDKFIKHKEIEKKIKFTDKQKEILHNIVKYNLNILTGSAGMGKSYLMVFIIELLDELHIDYRLVSPTAKAAKVLSNYTGKNAETIHRSIGLYREDQNEVYEIEELGVNVDEASMLGVSLADKLLSTCVNPDVRLLFIGDVSQIASISCGAFLQDMINSNQIPTVQLDKVFRQKDNGALDIATHIRLGETFIRHDFQGIKTFGSDCTIACIPQNKVVSAYKYYLNELLKKYDANNITILTPTKRGDLGTIEINKIVQQIVNPASPNKKEILLGKVIFRENDSILNIKNTYRKFQDTSGHITPVINGDGGIVKDVDKTRMIVDLDDGRSIIVPRNMMGQFIHSYATTIYKMQGSSNKAIIVIADKSSIFQLSRNLLYTACTRETEELIVLTQAETFNRAIKKKGDMLRHTWLKDMLIESSKEGRLN